ncbi:hypothetical protein N7532_011234 [Penicillium argentinense]|uniref:Telomerase reverse transcriptase n=1 Tax=Penicillium argentinense TaxID=1131581 RepID=A0A9W9EI22_9EURO|nr:uncharacterized protein N7532_011234 [Penicillium argentinense]KAJ5082191.1 hypothetical protein N7532_011234 [Penicillium argentinense]
MGKKRKRPSKPGPTTSSQTSITISPGRFKAPTPRDGPTHPVISLYYRELLSLRQYLLCRLPGSSKLRRRRIASLRPDPSVSTATGDSGSVCPASQDLADLLDSTLVGVLRQHSPKIACERQQDYRAFTQSQSRSILVSTDTGPAAPQSELIDYVIASIFKTSSASYRGPQHVLAHGFQYAGEHAIDSGIPGVAIQFPNRNVQALKQAPWADVLGLLGQNGDEIMIHLLLDCGIFVPLDAGKGIYYQLSGLPLSNLEKVPNAGARPTGQQPVFASRPLKQTNSAFKSRQTRRPNQIIFLRRRVLYCRHNGGAKQKLPFGLGSSHVFNRFSSVDSTAETVHLMKYIFPRQFGLENVFTIPGDRRDKSNQSQSHEFRENEISRVDDQRWQRMMQPKANSLSAVTRDKVGTKLPKRLRGAIMTLVQRMRVRHSRCSYGALLQHYCPDESIGPWKLGSCHSLAKKKTDGTGPSSSEVNFVTQTPLKSPATSQRVEDQPNDLALRSGDTIGADVVRTKLNHQPVPQHKPCVTDYATPAAAVSAFCRAVLHKLLPRQLFGEGPESESNCKIVMRHVDCFVKMRRYENLSLHAVCKSLKLTSIGWLVPPNLQQQASETKPKLSLSDFQKRTELLHEFIYYIFDSILIPLIRTNFYVTESQTHRNRLFYFRHDVWRSLTERPLADLKTKNFEKIDKDVNQGKSQYLGFGSLRLLPKTTGVRPILNLGKRVLKESTRNGKKRAYFVSINRTITPISNMLMYERQRNPKIFGSSLISMGDLHPRLKAFKAQLLAGLRCPLGNQPIALPKLYFVKLDIQACFDNIPQKQLLELVKRLVTEDRYRITKHVEVKPSVHGAQGKPFRKWIGRAAPLKEQQHLPDYLAKEAQIHKSNTVYLDDTEQTVQDSDWLLGLLSQHIGNNQVKIGKDFYRQRNGIPQGSVLSSLLCNFFLAQLEHDCLGFLRPENSLLMRFVDDFLFISTDVNEAMQFLQVMIRGQPSYGVKVNASKSMVNFTAAVDGTFIPRLEGSPRFPYLGCLINTQTLEIHQDQDRVLDGGDLAATALSNSLTVETTNLPGHAFRRKVLASFRQQMHPMYIDDTHNTRPVILGNLYTRFVTVGMKMYRYMKSLGGRAHPKPPIIIQTIHTLMLRAFAVIQERRTGSVPLSCFVKFHHIQFLAAAAFRFVLKRKQTRYAAVLQWLDSQLKDSRPKTNSAASQLTQVAKRGNALFEEWRF